MTSMVLPYVVFPLQLSLWTTSKTNKLGLKEVLICTFMLLALTMRSSNRFEYIHHLEEKKEEAFVLKILPLMSVLSLLIGAFMKYILDTVELLPLWIYSKENDAKPIIKWDLTNLPLPYKHNNISLGFFFFISLLPSIVYIETAEIYPSFAIFFTVVSRMFFYTLYIAYCLRYPDISMFGPHERNIEALGKEIYPYIDDKKRIEKDTNETTMRICRSFLPVISCDMITTNLIAVTRYFQDDILWSFSVAIILQLYMIIFLFIYYACCSYIEDVKEKKD